MATEKTLSKLAINDVEGLDVYNKMRKQKKPLMLRKGRID